MLEDPAYVRPLAGEAVALGGRLREQLEDFVVEEIPLVRPTGEGEHVVFQIEKRGMSTFDALLRISKGAKVSENDIGYAGLKDARAVTRQYMSVRRVPPERLLQIHHPRLRVVSAARHTAHLKVGYHRGNRFTIRLRQVRRERIPHARRALERFVARGMPNGYGSQRFGVRQDGHLVGRAVVDEDWPSFLDRLLGSPSPLERNPRVLAARTAYQAGDLERALALFPLRHRTEKKAAATLLRTGSPREAFFALGRRPRRIWVAAWQSYVFNRVLDRRVADGTFDRLLPGDIAALDDTGACFPVREGDADAGARPGASPTGPLVGHDLRLAEGAPGEIERAVMREAGAEPEAFRADHVRTRGRRRPLRAPVWEASLEEEGADTVVLRFALPPGSFATVLVDALRARPEPGTGRGGEGFG